MGGGGNTQTIQKSDPWSGQQPYLQELFRQAANYYLPSANVQAQSTQQTPIAGWGAQTSSSGPFGNTSARVSPSGFGVRPITQAVQQMQAPVSAAPSGTVGGPQYYPGQTIAAIDPRTAEGLDYATYVARNNLMQQGGAAQGAQQTLINASNINNNPNLQAAITAATEPVIRQFTDAGGTLSQIRSNAIANGGQGNSTRQGIAEGIALDRLSQNTLGIGAQMAQQAYQTGLDATAKGLALQPNVTQAMLQPGATLDAVGQEQRVLQQQFIDDAVQRWNYNQQLPGSNLANFQQLINGGFGGTSTSAVEAGKANPALLGLGGAAMGYGLAASMPALGVTGPVGAGIGLMAALLLGS